MTDSSFTPLHRRTTIVTSGENRTTGSHIWRPSVTERQKLILARSVQRLHKEWRNSLVACYLVAEFLHRADALSAGTSAIRFADFADRFERDRVRPSIDGYREFFREIARLVRCGDRHWQYMHLCRILR